MCHNYAQGVTASTALKPDEVVFTDMNRQIEHHIGVTPPPPSHVTMPPFSVTSCVYLWLCAST